MRETFTEPENLEFAQTRKERIGARKRERRMNIFDQQPFLVAFILSISTGNQQSRLRKNSMYKQDQTT